MKNQNVKSLENMRDLFLDIAIIADELIELSHKDEDGEDVEREFSNLMGRYYIKLLEISKLG